MSQALAIVLGIFFIISILCFKHYNNSWQICERRIKGKAVLEHINEKGKDNLPINYQPDFDPNGKTDWHILRRMYIVRMNFSFIVAASIGVYLVFAFFNEEEAPRHQTDSSQTTMVH